MQKTLNVVCWHVIEIKDKQLRLIIIKQPEVHQSFVPPHSSTHLT